MKRLIYLPIILLLFACNNEIATEQTAQESQKLFEPNPELEEERVPISKPEVLTFDTSFLPEGYEIITYGDSISNIVRGDLNGNEIEDVAVFAVLNKDGVDYRDAEAAHILVLENDGNGGFDLQSKSGNLIGFLNSYESEQLELQKNVIIVTHQGMRWHREMKFRYEATYEDYVLIGSEYVSYGGATHDGSGTVSTNYLTGVQTENLNEFDSETEELNELPEKRNTVSKDLVSISEINGENFYDY